MDNDQPSTSRTAGAGSEHDMISSPTSGSARQLARRQGLARMSAVTLGVGAAGVLGAVAIAVTLPDSTAASAAKSVNAAPLTTTTYDESSDDESSDDESSDDESSDDDSSAKLQTITAPTTTNSPPVATSGGS